MTQEQSNGLVSVVSPKEAGARGYQVTLARYGKAQMDRWRRKGGRRRNLTYEEIMAGVVATRRVNRRVSSNARRSPSRQGTE